MARTPAPPATPQHYVVDGSNIATEGRAMPSLQQLNEAVLAFIDEHPDALITVVVDATFGHRIPKNEVDAFDQAVANNELVTPPAGAVGRGDAFVLTIAHKAKAGILSNDSFQEFHGDYPWLFEPGRLIGGKPVPHVGWVFVERLPVRGPRSRQSVKDARNGKAPAKPARGSGSPLADQPMPVPTTPPPGVTVAKPKRAAAPAEPAAAEIATIAAAAKKPAAKTVNELLPFLEFVEQHPVGTSATVVVESYASHGAYARAGDVLVYLPLRLMGNPVPRSARSAVAIGEALAVVIAGYTPERRSIDAALPSAAEQVPATPAAEAEPAKPRKRAAKRGAAALTDEAAEAATPSAEPIVIDEPAAPTSRRRKKAAAAAPPAPAETAPPAADQAPASEPAKPGRRSRRKAAATPAPDEVAPPSVEPPATAPEPAKRPAKKAAKKSAKAAAKEVAKDTVKDPVKKAAKKAAKAPAKATAKPAAKDAGKPAAPAAPARARAAKKASS